MGKYRRYKNIIEMFLSSEKGKRVLNFCYSWGASVVIIGALFKLLHLPYANQILFVAMITERSLEMIIGIYGILKAGGAYLPIDPTYPEERISYMLADAAPKAVLTYKADLPANIQKDIPVIDLADSKVLEGVSENPMIVCKPNHLAYCIYTSGTTGKPKGVMIEHKGVTNLSRFYIQEH